MRFTTDDMPVYLCIFLLVRLTSPSADLSFFKDMGSRLAITNDFLILSDDADSQLIIIEYTRPWDSTLCQIHFNELTKVNHRHDLSDVYSVVLNSKPVKNENVAVMLGVDHKDKVHMIVLRLVVGECDENLDVRLAPIPWEDDETTIAFAVDPPGKLVCVTLLHKTICLDTRSLRRTEYANEKLWNDPEGLLHSHALVFTEDRRLLLVAYRYDEATFTKRPYLYVANLSDPSKPVSIGMMPLSIEHPWDDELTLDSNDRSILVSVHEDSKTMVIGMPRIDTVYLLSYRKALPELISTHTSPNRKFDFGQSVAMLGANSYAVLTSTSANVQFASKIVQVNE